MPIVGTPGAACLTGRGLPLALAEACGVQYIAAHCRRSAVTYPLHDQAGELVAVGVRYIDGGDRPKTRVGGRLGRGVFATPGAFDSAVKIVVEGPADALSLAACGFPAIALHRTSWPDWLPRRLAFQHVAVALDADAAGDERSPILIAELETYGAKPFRLQPARKDWNDLHREVGPDRLRRAVFDPLAGRLWRASWARWKRQPHAALAWAIDLADWDAFGHEIAVYESGSLLRIQQELNLE